MTLARLREVLASRTPGRFPFEVLPPEHLPEGGLRPAAVLVPLYEREGAVHVVLTRRNADLRHHGGQVSFPGGRIEPGEDPLTAALREAEEEVGLSPADVDVLGQLDETLVLATAFRLMPWVGVIPHPYPWKPHPGEVDEVLEVALADLLRPGVHRVAPRVAYGVPLAVHYFDLPQVTVWGATARVLDQLLMLWEQA